MDRGSSRHAKNCPTPRALAFRAPRFARQDAQALTAERPALEWFEEAVQAYGGWAKEVANWVTGQLFAMINLRRGFHRPGHAAGRSGWADEAGGCRHYQPQHRQEGIEEMVATGQSAAAIVKRRGWLRSRTSGLAGGRCGTGRQRR